MTHIQLKPPLKWAGGKRWLIPHIKSTWQAYSESRLVEPFCGGLAIALGLEPQEALLNDINPHLINFYQWLEEGLESEFSDIDHDEAIFYQNRDRFNELIKLNQHQSQEAAQLFYYLNRTCFNGLCRFNSSGYFNVPFGRYKTINYFSTKDFAAYQRLLAEWHFSCGDFQQLDIQPNDFIYVDPPYDVEFTKYSQEDFKWDDQIRLVKWLTQYDNPTLLSNQATDRILELYQDYGFEILLLEAPRRISRTGDRTPAQEVLAYRNIEKTTLKRQPKQLQLL